MTKTLSAANAARLRNLLDSFIRTEVYGIVTYEEFIRRRLADGGYIAPATVTDDAARRKLQREYDQLNHGFNVPWGNDRHPTTIKAQGMKDRLAGRIETTEYRLYASNSDRWSVIPKMLHDWATSLPVTDTPHASDCPAWTGENCNCVVSGSQDRRLGL